MSESNIMSIEQEIISWLHGRPDWQQEGVARNLANWELLDSDLEELTTLCKTVAGQKKSNLRIYSGFDGHDALKQTLHIVSIGDIHGIDNLRPRKPITFGEGNLVVVYGNNGSGKSGYVRILKNACGKANAGELRANVFGEVPAKRCCKIEYKIDGLKDTKEWTVDGNTLTELAAIDIFDSDNGRLYLNKESEVSYTPRTVALFDGLVRVCEGVRQRLQTEKQALPSKLPVIPLEYANTKASKLFGALKPTHNESDLASILSWSEEDQKKLNILEERLKTDDPAKLATSKRKQKTQIDGISQKMTNAHVLLTTEACQKIIKLNIDARNKRKIAIEGAAKALKSTSLECVGSETWRALWEAARRYSEEHAYPSTIFPNTADGAKCVLCQQPLLAEAQERLTEFELYVKGSLETAAVAAETEFQAAIKTLPQVQAEESLKTACQAAGLAEDEWLQRFLTFWKAADDTINQLRSPSTYVIEGLKHDVSLWLVDIQKLGAELELQAKQHETDAQSFDRTNASNEKIELAAKLWTSQQVESIKAELKRLKSIAQYDEWIKGTDHTQISRKAGEIAKKVITDAYINRFNTELEKLGAKRIKVELVKTSTPKGKPLHGIKLRNVAISGVRPMDILSDGEKRIVELAAFLADVTGRPSKAPFVFDDPISSLDQDYEEKTVDRLIELSEDRQVIIFTHRLSLFGFLCDKSSPHTACVRHEPWGAGEPGDVPLFGKNPEGALKKLRDERLTQAENNLNADGYEAYYPLAKSLCCDLRITVERIVELVFFDDVIQRHRREIKTKNKIGNLAKINAEDCSLIEDLMTTYSRYEHSQSSESPVDVPQPDIIRNDIDRLLAWHNQFKKRTL